MALTKNMSALQPHEVRRIVALYRKHGTGGGTVGRVSRTFSITESDARALATALTEPPPAPPRPKHGSVTDRITVSARGRQLYEAAETTVQRANAAEARGLN